MKTCTGCKSEKPLSDFNKRGKAADGLQHNCRTCVSAYNRRRYLEKSDQLKAAANAYYHANIEAGRASRREYQQAHKEAHGARHKAWKSQNEEHVRQYKKRHYDENWDRIRQYRQDNRQKRAIHEATRRARKETSEGNFTLEEWQAKCEQFGHRCYLCGEQLTEQTLVMEHVVPLSRGGAHTIDNIKPACAPCNNQKHNKTPEEFLNDATHQRGRTPKPAK